MPSKRLKAFLDGPLSDRRGGLDAARQAAAEAEKAMVGLLARSSSGSCVETDGPYEFTLKHQDPLFSYQRELVDALSECFTARKGRSALLSLPTGGGKTRTAIWFFRESAEQGQCQRLLWVAPSVELIDQAIDALQALWAQFPGGPTTRVSVGRFGFGRTNRPNETYAVFVTSQLAARRLQEIDRYRPDLLIFDEAHQAAARTFSRIVERVLAMDAGRVLGLTATPGRVLEGEAMDLMRLFQERLVVPRELGNNPIAELQARGVLARFESHRIALPTQWDQIRVRSVKQSSLSVDELALNPARFWATIQCVKELPESTKCVVFGASVAHCCALAGALSSSGMRASVISHETPRALRTSLLNRFAVGEIQVLVNKSLLATGYDCPGITDVVLATPIRSAILWEQIVGRASRGPAVGGTDVGCIWELDDHQKMHRKIMSYMRFLPDV